MRWVAARLGKAVSIASLLLGAALAIAILLLAQVRPAAAGQGVQQCGIGRSR